MNKFDNVDELLKELGISRALLIAELVNMIFRCLICLRVSRTMRSRN